MRGCAVVGSWSCVLGAVLLLTACGGDGGSVVPVPTSAALARPQCPSRHGGQCLGPLAAGTYTTVAFTPQVTYRVPDGWANYEDLPGNFLLLAPGGSVLGVDSGRSDYLGIYTGVAASLQSCEGGRDEAVGRSPQELVAALRGNPGLVVTEPQAVSIGGLDGLVVDITLAPGGGLRCDEMSESVVVPLLIGDGPAEFDHAQLPDMTTRLHVLAFGDGNVVIEVSDVADGTSMADFEPIVADLAFDEAAG